MQAISQWIPAIPTEVSAFTNDAGYITQAAVPTNVSQLNNDAGYITMDSVPAIPTEVSAFDNDAGYITQAAIPTNVSQLNNDAGYITMDSVPAIPAEVSAFDNDAGYITQAAVPTNVSAFTNDAGYLTRDSIAAESDPTVPAWAKESAKPAYDYSEIQNTPEIPTVPTNVSAFDNDAGYITMDSVPVIPAEVSAFTNDAGYITQAAVPTNVSQLNNDAGYITMDSVPAIPAEVSAFANDAGYITQAAVPTNVSQLNNDAGYITMDSVPAIPAEVSAFTNDAGYITQAAVPTNVSQLNNDAGYITRDSIPAGLEGSQTGDIMYWDAASSTWIMMPAGTSGQVLTMENGVPVWASLPDHVTMNLPPTVITNVPQEVTQSTALCGGVVTSDGSVQLTACGVCWSTRHFPTVSDAHVESDLSVSAFTSHISNLSHHTTYYVRAYATNYIGTAYGAEMTFTTADIPSDSLTMPDPCSGDTNTLAQSILGPNYLMCAGSDSVELTMNNYQYGAIQWQYSLDTVSWFDIPDAIDEQLTYKPEQTQFVRAAVSYSNCATEYSEVKLLQKTPAANAGISRTANVGDTLRLQANTEESATGTWQILQGSTGLLTAPTNAASKFFGTDSLYRLRWTLTNNCGTSSDDINVRYVQPKVSSKVVVVDTTDIIFSDSAQLANGYYVISFSDSSIVIGDSTILVSIVNGGFLRKVDSWDMRDDTTYAMYTSQASLSDLLESGVINFGSISSGSSEEENVVEHAIDHNVPTHNEPVQSMSAQSVEFLDHIPTRKELREHPEMNGKMYVMGMEFVREDDSNEDLNLRDIASGGTRGGSGIGQSGPFGFYNTPGISFENVDVRVDYPEVEYDRDTRYLKFGFFNAQFHMSGDLVITPSANGSKSSEDVGSTINNIPVCYYFDDKPIVNIIKVYEKLKLNGTVAIIDTMRYHFSITTSFTRGVRYDANTNSYIVDSTDYLNGYSHDIKLVSYDGVGSVNLDVTLEFCSDVFYYDQLGPYSRVIHKTNINHCSNTEVNDYDHIRDWKGAITSNLSAKLDLNNANIIERNITGSWSKEWAIMSKGRVYPQSIEVVDGDNQTINADGTLSLPISVKVLGNDNRTFPNPRVHFLPQDGGSVSEITVTPNQRGEIKIQTVWTPGELNGHDHQLNADVYDCNGQPIGQVIFTAHEPASQSASCTNSTLQLVIKPKPHTNNGELMLVPQNGTAPYTYWMDGNTISVNDFQFYVINMPAEGTHVIGLTDANGCYRVKSFNVGNTRMCQLTNLGLDYTATSGRIEVQGVNGNAPYLYALEGRGYTQNNVFTSLSPGTYTIHVMDDRGCENSKEVTVAVDNTATQGGHPCAGAETVTDIDGNVYPTLQIGTQCWMAENMRTTRYADGEKIGIGSGCFYPNNDSRYKSMGLLYTLPSATGRTSETNPSVIQGICPNGWHVPSDAEWSQLTSCPQVVVYPAKALATKEGWNSSSIQGSPGCDSYNNNGIGFNAAPAGQYYNGYSDFGVVAWFWSTTWHYINGDNCGTFNRHLHYNEGGVGRDYRSWHGASGDGGHAYSIRCLRD